MIHQFYVLFSYLLMLPPFQSLYDSLFLTFYNVFYTAALPLAYGILEQDIPAETLSKRPDIYQRFGKNVLLGWGEFVKWTLLGQYRYGV